MIGARSQLENNVIHVEGSIQRMHPCKTLLIFDQVGKQVKWLQYFRLFERSQPPGFTTGVLF